MSVQLSETEKCMMSEIITIRKLLLVNQATSAGGQRSFSSARKLKTWLRSTMTQTRFNLVIWQFLKPTNREQTNFNLSYRCCQWVCSSQWKSKKQLWHLQRIKNYISTCDCHLLNGNDVSIYNFYWLKTNDSVIVWKMRQLITLWYVTTSRESYWIRTVIIGVSVITRLSLYEFSLWAFRPLSVL